MTAAQIYGWWGVWLGVAGVVVVAAAALLIAIVVLARQIAALAATAIAAGSPSDPSFRSHLVKRPGVARPR